MLWKQPLHPTVIPVVSTPAFILGGIVAGVNWMNLGQPIKGRNTIRNSIIGTIVMVVLCFVIPKSILRQFWPVYFSINIAVGLALRTLQLPTYETWRS